MKDAPALQGQPKRAHWLRQIPWVPAVAARSTVTAEWNSPHGEPAKAQSIPLTETCSDGGDGDGGGGGDDPDCDEATEDCTPDTPPTDLGPPDDDGEIYFSPDYNRCASLPDAGKRGYGTCEDDRVVVVVNDGETAEMTCCDLVGENVLSQREEDRHVVRTGFCNADEVAHGDERPIHAEHLLHQTQYPLRRTAAGCLLLPRHQVDCHRRVKAAR